MKTPKILLTIALVLSSFFPLAASIRTLDFQQKPHIGHFSEFSPDVHQATVVYLLETQQGTELFWCTVHIDPTDNMVNGFSGGMSYSGGMEDNIGYLFNSKNVDAFGLAECTEKVLVSIKSFIASLGWTSASSKQGPAKNWKSGQQKDLKYFMLATDLSYSEDPSDGKFGGGTLDARIASKREFVITYDNKTNKISKIKNKAPQHVQTKGGSEPANAAFLHGIVHAAEKSKVNVTADKITFTWFVKGRPPVVTEPSFLIIHPRKSVFIWHKVEGEISIVKGKPVVKISTFEGSRFPSHRVFSQIGKGKWKMEKEITQGHISNLWISDPNNKLLVK